MIIIIKENYVHYAIKEIDSIQTVSIVYNYN
jgi:hypothetical protein